MKKYYATNKSKWGRTPEQNEHRNALRRKQYAESEPVRLAARAAAKNWQKANPEKRKSQRVKKYGLEASDVADLLATQQGRCAICGHSDLSNANYFPLVDHCHKTGRVRGLLCMNCNQGLGKFKDDPDRLFTAIAYLTKNG